jgi:phospholipid transport system substrate-binding protein
MHNNAGGWKVYDVVINNASLVGNYRTSFSNEIRQGGIDGLIAKLGEMNTRIRE